MEIIPRLYADSKYTRYLPAVVYGSYTMAVVTVCTVGRQWFTLYILQAVPLIFTLVIVQLAIKHIHSMPMGWHYSTSFRRFSDVKLLLIPKV